MQDSGIFRQFFILLYKGALLRKRHYIVTFFEIVIPVLIASIGPIIVGSTCRPPRPDDDWSKPQFRNATIYEPKDPFLLEGYSSKTLHFVYAPASEVAADLMSASLKQFVEKSGYQGKISENIEGLKDEAAVEKYWSYILRNGSNVQMIATIFRGLETKDHTMGNALDYTIRFGDGYYYQQIKTNVKYRTRGPADSNDYLQNPFLSWQMAVEESFIAKRAETKGQTLNHKVWIQRFPYPEHYDNNTFSVLTMVPWLITYSYFIFIINMIRRLIEEKSNGSKELLKMMGMSDLMYWVSTFINYIVVALFTIIITTILYKIPLGECQFIKYTDFGVLLLTMVLYITQTVLFGMMFSIFFNKGIFAIIVYIIVHDVSFALIATNVFMIDPTINYLPISVSGKLGISLLPDGALLTLCYFMSYYESMEKSITWSNLNEYYATSDLSVSMTLGMMVAACLMYIVLIWYLDAVWPWQPGVPKPFYFMFTKSYWNIVDSSDEDERTFIKNQNNIEFFEPEPRGTNAGVVIKNLSKEFRTGLQKKMAVNDVSLNIFEGQITALLGHNGAGKTTTINILTGLYTPTKGTASINGLDILRNTTKARRGLGVCPQHNVLFDTLTAEEHLRIYAALKGVPWSELGAEAEKTLGLLKLLDKRNELVKTLSGGMKRKLSLGIAIIGGSKVLFLDEPTSGMDVEARRGIWDTLKDIRLNRTIVLTTHYMEEADILGDRIAIMAEGEIQCCGSPMFLKNKFGTGYHLHVVKGEGFDLRTLSRFLEMHMPGTVMTSESRKEVNFKLASSSDGNFGKLFEEVERNKIQLGIASYGITVTTMEDVFLKVASLADVKYSSIEEDRNGTNGEMNDMLETTLRRTEVPKMTLFLNQVLALFLKRVHYARRHWSILLTQLVLPFVFICLCLYIINLAGASRSDNPPLKMDLQSVYGSKTDGFYHAQKTQVENIAQTYKRVLEGQKVIIEDVDDPTPYILKKGKKDMSRYWMKFLAGGMFDVQSGNSKNLTAWYNGEPYHALPMSVLLMHQALLKTIDDSASISLINYPLPMRQSSYFDQSGTLNRVMASVFFPLALGFLSGCYVLLPINERVSKAKLLQLMSGIPKFVYWIVMFAWDYLVHFVISILLIIPFAIFNPRVFFHPHSEAIGSVLLLMLSYGWAIIPFCYLVSLIFKKGNTGFSVIVTVAALFGVALVSTFSTLSFTYLKSPYKIVEVIIWILRILPPFSATLGFSNVFGLVYRNAFCEGIPKDDLQDICLSPTTREWDSYYKCCPNLCKNDCMLQINPLTWDKEGCGRDIVFLTLDGFFYFILLFLIENNYMSLFCRYLKRQIKGSLRSNRNVIVEFNQQQDSDVVQEKNRVLTAHGLSSGSGQDALVSVDLAKSYSNFYAVDHLTFGIHREECFGLLGVNGAGKTTTFRMLTGDCSPGEGNAFIQNYSLSLNLEKFQSFLGYCPQFDALIGRLTGREMLMLFGRLRGLTGRELDDQINKMIRLTDLTKHADKPCEVYSGGNKRKLSIGVALMAFPPLILLDEPTAGVDPVSRRKIWAVLAKARNEAGSAVLLTTHSMEETEALCGRLAIMVNGQLRCLGSIQHLKSKYGQGYTLKIKMKSEVQDNPEVAEAMKSYVHNGLRGAQLKDEHQGMLQYQVVDPSVTLSHLFNFMSHMKTQYSLEDYLISETTLEQIFLTFAKDQRITAK